MTQQLHYWVYTQRIQEHWCAGVAQSGKHLTSARVMISHFVGSSPVLGSVLTARSLEPASDSVSSSLSAPSALMLCLCLSKINLRQNKDLPS